MIEIGLQWSKARAYEAANVKGVRVIRPVGERPHLVEPFKIEGNKPLHVRFANLDGSEESCLKFANAYGLLRSPFKESPYLAERTRRLEKGNSRHQWVGVGAPAPGKRGHARRHYAVGKLSQSSGQTNIYRRRISAGLLRRTAETIL